MLQQVEPKMLNYSTHEISPLTPQKVASQAVRYSLRDWPGSRPQQVTAAGEAPSLSRLAPQPSPSTLRDSLKRAITLAL
jgi:hypothetical protein